MSAEPNIVPISPEVAEKLEQARLVAAFDAICDAGGLLAGARMASILMERLVERTRKEWAPVRPGASE